MSYSSDTAICCALLESITYLHVGQFVVVSFVIVFGWKESAVQHHEDSLLFAKCESRRAPERFHIIKNSRFHSFVPSGIIYLSFVNLGGCR